MSYIARNIALTVKRKVSYSYFKTKEFYIGTHVFNNLYLTILQWISFFQVNIFVVELSS